METEIKKLYYGIGEVSERLNVSATALRFWCQYFNIEVPVKQRGLQGQRRFMEKDLEKIRAIIVLKARGLKLEAIRTKIQRCGWPTRSELEQLKNSRWI